MLNFGIAVIFEQVPATLIAHLMTSEEKKAFLLLNSVIFHYHGLDEDEQEILNETAEKLNANAELEWANQFISTDYYDAFERAREFLAGIMNSIEKAKRLEYMKSVWEANMAKGYVSEMEATAMLKLAKDWDIETDLIKMIKKI